ncbi:hypothetical protein RHMOL_Rhmol07G0207300 [Rhododendron molle]|uniref:Uncharacterized protein n=1 Tax=Rhododendron molle TaxID=49168 RepID=A0ACC0N2N2_RHOML|nr:hypothetical protein RHMOL_Rhmol07G0207300 [Rhododendron molle]
MQQNTTQKLIRPVMTNEGLTDASCSTKRRRRPIIRETVVAVAIGGGPDGGVAGDGDEGDRDRLQKSEEEEEALRVGCGSVLPSIPKYKRRTEKKACGIQAKDGEEEGLMMEAIKTEGILPIVHPHSFSENHRRSRNKEYRVLPMNYKAYGVLPVGVEENFQSMVGFVGAVFASVFPIYHLISV